MTRTRQEFYRLCVADIVEAVGMWRVWLLSAASDLTSRYRRSTLGPFWASISMGMQALVTAMVLGLLFKQSIPQYLPFICLSLVIWYFLLNTVNEGSAAFIGAAETILFIRRPYTFYVLQTVWRNLVLAAHSMVVFLIVALLLGVWPSATWLLAIPGLALLILNATWAAMFAAIASARFGDVPLIVQNAFTVLFWLTPIVYRPQQLGGQVELVVGLNPLTYIVDVARGPLLNEVPGLASWAVAVLTAIVGSALTLALFARTRHRIAFWI